MCRKITCFVMSFVSLLTLFIPAAATETDTKSAYDLEIYMVLNTDGLIEFDTEEAISNGFPTNMVERVAENIEFMNDLVLDGETTINDDFTATVYCVNSCNTRMKTNETKVVVTPWGYILYLSIQDTADIVSSLPSTNTWLDIGILLAHVDGAAGLSMVGLFFWSNTIRSAASHGTGIYFEIYDDGTTAIPMCSVGPR